MYAKLLRWSSPNARLLYDRMASIGGPVRVSTERGRSEPGTMKGGTAIFLAIAIPMAS